MKRKTAKCIVEFKDDVRGTDALLRAKRTGSVLNMIHMGFNPSKAQRTRARKRLMRGCAELSRRR